MEEITMKKIRNQVIKFRTAVTMKALQAKEKLSENTGEGYVDTASASVRA